MLHLALFIAKLKDNTENLLSWLKERRKFLLLFPQKCLTSSIVFVLGNFVILFADIGLLQLCYPIAAAPPGGTSVYTCSTA